MLAYFMYYYETWMMPAMLRQEKMASAWAAGGAKHHANLWRLNHAHDRQLRYSAISRALLLDHVNHTKPKDVAATVAALVGSNRKVYDAFAPDSKRRLLWQVRPPLM